MLYFLIYLLHFNSILLTIKITIIEKKFKKNKKKKKEKKTIIKWFNIMFN